MWSHLIKSAGPLLILLLAWPIQSYAFPDNSILDGFGGTDNTSPPNSNWTNGVTGTVTGAIRIRSNAVTGITAGTLGDAYWNVQTFGADCEAYVTIVNIASFTNGAVHCRLVNIGSNTTDGYNVTVLSSNIVRVVRRDNGAGTTLGADISQTIAVGDSFGIKTVGDQICAWYKPSGGSWAQMASGCRTDATYSAGGSIGLGVTGGNNTTGLLDDFGGGTVGVGAVRTNCTLLGVCP